MKNYINGLKVRKSNKVNENKRVRKYQRIRKGRKLMNEAASVQGIQLATGVAVSKIFKAIAKEVKDNPAKFDIGGLTLGIAKKLKMKNIEEFEAKNKSTLEKAVLSALKELSVNPKGTMYNNIVKIYTDAMKSKMYESKDEETEPVEEGKIQKTQQDDYYDCVEDMFDLNLDLQEILYAMFLDVFEEFQVDDEEEESYLDERQELQTEILGHLVTRVQAEFVNINKMIQHEYSRYKKGEWQRD